MATEHLCKIQKKKPTQNQTNNPKTLKEINVFKINNPRAIFPCKPRPNQGICIQKVENHQSQGHNRTKPGNKCTEQW